LKDDIAQLRELQEIDLQIIQLDAEIASGNTTLVKRKSAIEKYQEDIAALQQKIDENGKRRRDLEAELEDDLSRIKDRQSKLMNVQTNREYQSLLKETEDSKKANKRREEELVALMEHDEALKAKIEEKNNLCTGEETLFAEEREKVEDQAAKLSSKKEKIIKSRKTKSKDVPANILKKYDILKDRRNGIAVVSVTNGVCTGCFMNIPPQLINELLKEEKMHCCPTCHRIIYHQADTQEA
jgi:hypothetical protein